MFEVVSTSCCLRSPDLVLVTPERKNQHLEVSGLRAKNMCEVGSNSGKIIPIKLLQMLGSKDDQDVYE